VATDRGQAVDPDKLRKFDRNLLDAGKRLAPRVLESVPFCWFCDCSSGTRSKEHIFPQWLLRHHGAMDEKVQPHRISMALGGALASQRGERPLRAHVNGEVCASCNNGWMASLEASTQPILTRSPLRGRIAPDEAAVLARWFAKTAVNLNVSQPYRLLVDATSRHALATGIPDQFAVHLFRVRRQNGVFDWVQKSPDSGVVPSGRVGEFIRLTALTLVTHIRVADLVAVVVYVPEPMRSTAVLPEETEQIHPLPTRLPDWEALPHHDDYLGVFTHWNAGDTTP
jgi:hypothetical protein